MKKDLMALFDELKKDDNTRWAYDVQRRRDEIACGLVKFRTDKDWTQEQLANYLGVPVLTIQKYESGEDDE